MNLQKSIGYVMATSPIWGAMIYLLICDLRAFLFVFSVVGSVTALVTIGAWLIANAEDE